MKPIAMSAPLTPSQPVDVDQLRAQIETLLTGEIAGGGEKGTVARGLSYLIENHITVAGAFFNDCFHLVAAGKIQKGFEGSLLRNWQKYAKRVYPAPEARVKYYLGVWAVSPGAEISGLEAAAKEAALSAASEIADGALRQKTLAELNAEFAV